MNDDDAAHLKIALITGCSGSIGIHIARALSAAEHSVAVGYRENQTAAMTVVQEIVDAGGAACAVKVDLSDPSTMRDALATISSELGGAVSVLVNNAVAWPESVEQALPFHTAENDDWAGNIRTNLEGTLHLTRLALGPMVDVQWGRVITISTDLVDGSLPADVSYLAAKGGMTAASHAIAWEVGQFGVTVNMVAPGLTVEKGRSVPSDVVAGILARTPRRQLTAASEIASVVAFLASDDASAITSQVIRVNGGH